jgi:hypothetical protein
MKKFFELKEGDKIWILSRYDTVPVLYEAEIWKDSGKQSCLSFPEYCLIYYYCPKLNSNKLEASLFGEKTQGINGNMFFTCKNSAVACQKELAQKLLSQDIKHYNELREEIKQLKSII